MDNKTFLIAGIVLALLVGVVAVFLASGDPDGLESTALMVQGQKTLTGDTPENADVKIDTTGKFSYESPMPDYSLSEQLGPLGGIIAIITGTLLAFGMVLSISKVLIAKKKARETKTNQ
jgi:cobalt/nickel transport protein